MPQPPARPAAPPIAEFDDRLWPVNCALFMLAGLVVGVIVLGSDFRDPRLMYNGWFRIGVVVVCVGVLLWGIARLRTRMLPRLQLSVGVSLLVHLLLVLLLHTQYLQAILLQRDEPGEVPQPQEIVTLPDYYREPAETVVPQSWQTPVDSATPDGAQRDETRLADVDPGTPRERPQRDDASAPSSQPSTVDMQRAEVSAPRRSPQPAGIERSRQEQDVPLASAPIAQPAPARMDPPAPTTEAQVAAPERRTSDEALRAARNDAAPMAVRDVETNAHELARAVAADADAAPQTQGIARREAVEGLAEDVPELELAPAAQAAPDHELTAAPVEGARSAAELPRSGVERRAAPEITTSVSGLPERRTVVEDAQPAPQTVVSRVAPDARLPRAIAEAIPAPLPAAAGARQPTPIEARPQSAPRSAAGALASRDLRPAQPAPAPAAATALARTAMARQAASNEPATGPANVGRLPRSPAQPTLADASGVVADSRRLAATAARPSIAMQLEPGAAGDGQRSEPALPSPSDPNDQVALTVTGAAVDVRGTADSAAPARRERDAADRARTGPAPRIARSTTSSGRVGMRNGEARAAADAIATRGDAARRPPADALAPSSNAAAVGAPRATDRGSSQLTGLLERTSPSDEAVADSGFSKGIASATASQSPPRRDVRPRPLSGAVAGALPGPAPRTDSGTADRVSSGIDARIDESAASVQVAGGESPSIDALRPAEVDARPNAARQPARIAAPEGPGGLAAVPSPQVGIPSRRARPQSEVVHTEPERFLLERSAGRMSVEGAASQGLAPAYRLRDPETRRETARSQGGSEASERAVELGLDFLARHQAADGSWSLDRFAEGRTGYPDPGYGQLQSDTAATGLALLAFLGAGYTHQHDKYREVVSDGLDHLLAAQKPDGDLFSGGSRVVWLYSHGIASIVLCEAYGMTRDQRLREPAQRALEFIAAAQHPELGGWRYRPRWESDTSVSGWQLMALRSGQLAGLDVSADSYAGVARWLDTAQASAEDGSRYIYLPGFTERNEGRPSKAMTAEGLLMRLLLGWNRSNEQVAAGADYLMDNLPAMGTAAEPLRDAYYWYYATQVMFEMKGDAWQTWNDHLRDMLVAEQERDGPLAGSWHPAEPVPDRWGEAAGRLYVTAMHLLILEVYYRHLPLYQSLDD